MIDSTWYTRITEVPVRQAAGGIVIRREEGQLWVALTVEHEADVDVITLPKGGVETGESVLQAAVREIREETGLQHLHLLQGEPLLIEERYGFGKGIWICCTWFLFVTEENQSQPTESKHTLLWAPLGSLPELFWPGERDLLSRNKEFITRQMAMYAENGSSTRSE